MRAFAVRGLSRRTLLLFALVTLAASVLVGARWVLVDHPPHVTKGANAIVLIDGDNSPAAAHVTDGAYSEVTLVAERCLGFDGNTVVAWPRGATVRESSDGSVEIEVDGNHYGIGDTVIYGSHVELDWSEEYAELLPVECQGFPVTGVAELAPG